MTTTPQHHIIKETSDTVSRLLQDEFKRNGYKRVHIVDQAPKPDAVEGKLPAVSCYLYQLSLDPHGVHGNATSEIVEVPQEDGTIKEFARNRRLWLRLDYLLSAWAQTPEDEQLLLGLILRTILDNEVVPREKLRGTTFEPEHDLPLALSTRLDEGTLSRFWGSLNQPVRPAVQLWTDDELRREGLARDVVRAVQDARKSAGLNVEDRIVLTLGGDGELLEAARAHEQYVAGETLATSLTYDGGGTTTDIEGRPLSIGLERA
jgi:hypothetical protein